MLRQELVEGERRLSKAEEKHRKEIDTLKKELARVNFRFTTSFSSLSISYDMVACWSAEEGEKEYPVNI